MKVKHWLIYIIYIALLHSLAFCATSCHRQNKDSEAKRTTQSAVDTTALMVMRVQSCARLYTAEMKIHKLITHTDEPRIKGKVLGLQVDLPARMGDRRIAIPIDVTLKAYIDFANFTADNLQRTDSTLVITLPDPHVIITSTRVDNQGTRQYVDAFRSRYTDAEIANFAQQGADSITAHLSRFGLEERAKQSAARQLIPLFSNLGYTESQITLRFGRNYSDHDWTKLQTN